MSEAISLVAHDVCKVLTKPHEGISNITEWAKKQACWARIRDMKVELPDEFIGELISLKEVAENERVGKKDWKILNGIEVQTAVVNAGTDFWRDLHAWATERRLLSSKDDGILRVALQIPKKIPSEKQSKHLMEFLARIKNEGYSQKLNSELERQIGG